jgi:hypothetical protein
MLVNFPDVNQLMSQLSNVLNADLTHITLLTQIFELSSSDTLIRRLKRFRKDLLRLIK